MLKFSSIFLPFYEAVRRSLVRMTPNNTTRYTLFFNSIPGVKNHFLTFNLLMWRIGRVTNSIPIYSYIQQDATLHSLFISGNCIYIFRVVFPPIIRSTCNFIYSIWYLSQHRYCYLPLSWNSWDWFECAVGGVRHPQHTQTGSNSSTIAIDSSR
jgi:hypothetical protein